MEIKDQARRNKSAIHKYLERGWNVIPIQRKGKAPLIKWERYQTEKASKEDLIRWEADHSGCNWGIVTGAMSGLVVLDFDSAEAEERAKEKGLPETLTVKTPRGRHYYYLHPAQRVPCSSGALFEHMDVRGDGGYVVAPPSRIGKNGSYEFEVGSIERELPPLPGWVLEGRADVTEPVSAQEQPAANEPPTDLQAYLQTALGEELVALVRTPEGKRNEQLNKSAFNLGQIIAAGSLNRQIVETMLVGCALQIGLPEDEIKATIKSGIEAGMSEPRWDQAQKETRFKLLSVEDLEALADPEWLVDGVLPLGGFGVLYGAPGVGKSFLALDWACRIAAGYSDDIFSVAEGPAVYVCAEGASGYKKRVAAWKSARVDLAGKAIRFVTSPVILASDDERKELISSIRASGLSSPALIVIDTLARCFGEGDENMAKDMNAFIAGADSIRHAFPGAAVLVVHHSGKDDDRGARGSTALRGACDTELKLTKDKKILKLSCRKQKDGEPFEGKCLALQPAAGGTAVDTSCVVVAASGQQAEARKELNANDQKALTALAKEWTKGMAHNEWMKASGLPKGTFKHARGRLEKAGRVLKDPQTNCYRVTDKVRDGSNLEPGS